MHLYAYIYIIFIKHFIILLIFIWIDILNIYQFSNFTRFNYFDIPIYKIRTSQIPIKI